MSDLDVDPLAANAERTDGLRSRRFLTAAIRIVFFAMIGAAIGGIYRGLNGDEWIALIVIALVAAVIVAVLRYYSRGLDRM